jgi:peptidyl-prolyl cis-trans isomerase SurA
MKIKLYFLTLFVSMISLPGFAQKSNNPNNQLKLDGVAAVVGDEIVLNSDIERDYIQAKMQGYQVENQCEFLENILIEKLLLTKAKEDTLINITNDQIDRQVEGTVQRFLSQGSEPEILAYFGMNTMAELKLELRGIMRDQAYANEKQNLVTKGLDATPEEVRNFYETYKEELPDIPEEVSLSHIVIYPEIFPENEQSVIEQLAGYKQEILDGASFSTKAILYSNDPGSASNGGLIKNVKRGQMVPEFDAVVFNLQEGEISDPFKTDFGYHIAMLEKRRGQELDIRHILIQLKPTAEEIALTREKVNKIIQDIENGEMTFKEAALKYSVDKYTKYNAGVLSDENTGEDRMDRSKLPTKLLLAISGMEDGAISEPFEDEFNRQPVIRFVKLNQTIPTHKINLETDYARLKNLTINTKRQETVMNWVGEQINDTFVKIHTEYDECDFRLNWRKEDK